MKIIKHVDVHKLHLNAPKGTAVFLTMKQLEEYDINREKIETNYNNHII